ncbi:MAG: VOC family protein [bacterium]
MQNTNKFFWYDLMSANPQAAAAFYNAVVGWHPVAVEGEVPYTTLNVVHEGRSVGVGGIMAHSAAAIDPGPHAFWIGYVYVDDVDAAQQRAEELGGTVHLPKTLIPGVGHFAVIGDPHGAGFQLLHPFPREHTPQLPNGYRGTCVWRELHAGDHDVDWQFYAQLFNWRETTRMDMGSMGFYRMFGADDEATGATMSATDGVPRWVFYFAVDDLDAAQNAVTQHGGRVLQSMHQVPDGSWICVCEDPEGAKFGLRSVATPRNRTVSKVRSVTPFLWFDGQAQEAMHHYTSIFEDSRIISDSAMSVSFELEGQRFLGLNAGPRFTFNEAISMFVTCADQAEVDRLWERLGEGGEPGRCGWLKDKFGLWWQIVPEVFEQLVSMGTEAQSQRVFQAMMKMTKFNVAELEAAFAGED